MKVRFFPRDIGMFRNEDFDFSIRGKSLLTLETRYKWDYKDFYDRAELIEYLKSMGVRLDDHKHPLKFDAGVHSEYGIGYSVIQWSYLGYMVEL